MSEKTIQELIKDETNRRLEIMGDKSYQFPETITKKDISMILILIFICATLICLCMMGVIK